MAIRGSRIPFLGKAPILADGEARSVKLLPVHETVANGRMGLLGQWISRPGYEVSTKLGARVVDGVAVGVGGGGSGGSGGGSGGSGGISGSGGMGSGGASSSDNEPVFIPSTGTVVHLASHQGLVAFTENGEVHRSTDEGFRGSERLDGALTGPYRPMSVVHDQALIVTDGGDPMVVEGHRVRRLGIPTQFPDVPTVVATNKGKVPAGEYRYRLTLTTVAGESLVGPPSAIVTHEGSGEHGTRIYAPALTEEEMRFVLSWSVYRETYQANDIGLIEVLAIDTPYVDDKLPATAGDAPTVDQSGSMPPPASECAVVGDYVVLAGHDSKEIQVCSPGNHDYWPGGFTTQVQLDAGDLQTIRGTAKELLVFRTTAVDIYSLIASTEIFARRIGFPRGCLAKKSVVMESGIRPYWLGDDFCFYRVNGAAPEAIGALEQEFVATLRSPQSCYGQDFPRERVIRWFFPQDGVCLGYNYAQSHFLRDWSWDGKKQIPLDVHCAVQAKDGRTLVGLSDGRIGEWSPKFTTDAGGRIRTIRRFTMPLTGDGKQARANKLVFRHERGVHDLRDDSTLPAWTNQVPNSSDDNTYRIGDRVRWAASGENLTYICIQDHTTGSYAESPGYIAGRWEDNWRVVRADDNPKITIRYGFDQGSWAGEHEVSLGTLGDTQPYSSFGPCGRGREMTIEMERAASVFAAFTGGAVIAQPLGDAI